MTHSSAKIDPGPGFYAALHRALSALFEGERDPIANTANMAALVYQEMDRVSWAGFYFRRGSDLVLGPFQGPPACIRIPWGEGVCGRAAQSGQILRVDNVDDFPGHIACDPRARSELVIPFWSAGSVVGVFDLDSYAASRFQESDQTGLAACVRLLEGAVDWHPTLM
ncbi:GAF sensor protein [mine drainage metagenome]|uniref:GAF sensor protein n=1 Tax=mine drainage metagenome TaxID=410659 RepID=T0YXH2_9ZZZZ